MSSSLGGERRLRPQDLVEQWSPLPRWWPMVRALPPRVCSGAVSDPLGLLQSFLPVSPLLSPLLSSLLQALSVGAAAGGKAGNTGWLCVEAEHPAET